MRIKLIFFIALKYLRSKKSHKLPSISTTLSFFGVMLSVATLIVVLSVMNGFVDELMKKILGVNAHISLSRFGMEGIKNSNEIMTKVKSIDGVARVESIIEGQGMIVNPRTNQSNGVMIRGSKEDDFIKIDEIYKSIKFASECIGGDLFNKENGVIIGSQLAQNIGLNNGDKVSIVSSVLDNTIFGSIPKYKTFNICGIFESGSSMYDASLMYMDFNIASKLFKYKDDEPSIINIYLKNYTQVDDIKWLLQKENIWNEYISDWKTQNDGLFHAMKIERSVMTFILTLFVVVAMFGIFANMINMIGEKSKSIAIMRSIGFSKGEISQIFFITGFIIGFMGTIFGSMFGILFALNIESIKGFLERFTGVSLLDGAVYFLSYLPSQVQIYDVCIIFCGGLILSIISSLVPARKASSTNISETLRQI